MLVADNSSRQIYHRWVKDGMTKEDAFFAVIDHWNSLHFHDRNRYGEEIKKLKEWIARMETKGQDE